MTTSAHKLYISPEAYLEAERAATERHEYWNGRVYAMSGGSARHADIASNLLAELAVALRGRCRVRGSDMRVKVSETGYTYPDLSIVCGESQLEDQHGDSLVNPVAIVEVLSPSTEAYDRGVKFHHYQHIATLREYILVAQAVPVIDRYFRNADGLWTFETIDAGALRMATPECEIALSAIYADITFDDGSTIGSPHP